LSLTKAEKELRNIQPNEQLLLFERLETECRSTSDLKTQPPAMKGLLRIIKVNKSLESRLIDMLESYPYTELGPWAIAEFSGLTEESALHKFKTLLTQWGKQTQNKTLQQLALQILKSQKYGNI
jgi:hypothetical protein